MNVLKDTAWVAAFALALGAVTAAVVSAAGWAPELRDWYGLTPSDPVDVPVWTLWSGNMLVMLLVFFACVGMLVKPTWHAAWDFVVSAVLTFNVMLVALALAAYGMPLLRLVVPHGALELLALACVAAAYLDVRRGSPGREITLAIAVPVVAALLLVAAVIESSV